MKNRTVIDGLEAFIFPPSSNANVRQGTVVLGHAMFNTCDYLMRPKGKSLKDFLVNEGFEVCLLNLTGYGGSRSATRQTNFDTYVEDYEHVFKHLAERNSPLYFIGHSVGSLAGLSAIAQNPGLVSHIVLAAPAIWSFTEPSNCQAGIRQKTLLSLSHLISLLPGGFPSRLFNIGRVPAPSGYFKQFSTWSKTKRMTSLKSNTDYASSWGNISADILLLEAADDSMMAPPENIRWVVEHLPQNSSVKRVDGNTFGFNSDHFSLIYGKKASDHVWPELASFLKGKT